MNEEKTSKNILPHYSREEFDKIIEESNNSLIDAYSRMDMSNQAWTKYTSREVDYIEKHIPSKDSIIVDIGCGTARHIAELYSRGYHNIYGYDFSSKIIDRAKGNNPNIKDHLYIQDCRTLESNIKADVVLCLYDVIGSFANEEDNLAIIKAIKNITKKDSIVLSSVMNFELTYHIAKYIYNVYEEQDRFFNMPLTSNNMQKTGNVFNPDLFVIDSTTHIIYRRELFINENNEETQYLVRDRRYTMEQIKKMFSKQGFSVVASRYVQAGRWDIPLTNIDSKAKEILLVLKKE